MVPLPAEFRSWLRVLTEVKWASARRAAWAFRGLLAFRAASAFQTVLAGQIADAAKVAGLTVVSSEAALDASGAVTTKFVLALASDPAKTELLELSENLDLSRADLITDLQIYLAESAKRLKNPRPDCYMTLHGLPLSFGKFNWPFHASTSGADTFLVHGEVRLEDGEASPLHSKVSASMTVTFAEIVPAPEQPFAEGLHLQRHPQDHGPGTARARQERQSSARARHHPLLQPLAEEVHIQRHQR